MKISLRDFIITSKMMSKMRFSTITQFAVRSGTSDIPQPMNFNEKFQMPQRENTLMNTQNSHPNDAFITFDEPSHTYTYDGKPMKTSVTTFIGEFFPKFEPEVIIPKMMAGVNWPRPEYTYPDGKVYTKEEIIKKWERIGLYARNRGTWMHYNIECFLNQLPYDNTIPEIKMFIQFYEQFIQGREIIPYRTEWSIAAPDIQLAGSIDFVGKLSNGNYCIMDWKRSKGLLENLQNNYQKKALPPIDHYDDCDGSKYSLQINTYKYILETYYGLKIDYMSIVSCHPAESTFHVVEVPDLTADVMRMIDYSIENNVEFNPKHAIV